MIRIFVWSIISGHLSPEREWEGETLRDPVRGSDGPFEFLRDFPFPTGPPGLVSFVFGIVTAFLANFSGHARVCSNTSSFIICSALSLSHVLLVACSYAYIFCSFLDFFSLLTFLPIYAGYSFPGDIISPLFGRPSPISVIFIISLFFLQYTTIHPGYGCVAHRLRNF